MPSEVLFSPSVVASIFGIVAGVAIREIRQHRKESENRENVQRAQTTVLLMLADKQGLTIPENVKNKLQKDE